MKRKLLTLAIAAMAFAIPSGASAQCVLDIAAVPSQQPGEVPDASAAYLASRLQSMITARGTSAIPGSTRFFITGRFDHIMMETLPGPPIQTALHTDLTLYIADAETQTVFSSVTLELRGVGTSPQRAFVNALRTVNPRNRAVENFIEQGRNKILAYFDANYRQLIARAEKAAALHNYEEALWQLSVIPECCTGYNEALKRMAPIMRRYMESESSALLASGRAAWAAKPNAEGAKEALDLLVQIAPESPDYAQAERLLAEIKKTVKEDADFELRQKYADEIELEKRTIEAAREVGAAYGRGQQPVTNNINWLVR